jgi:CRP-like cAMP-binding protein
MGLSSAFLEEGIEVTFSASPRAPITNRLISRLPASDRERMLAHSELVQLTFGDVLVSPGETIRYVYFPTSSFISLISPMDSTSLEVALAGSEGMFGVPVALGVAYSNVRALVQGAGPAWRMSAASFRRELAANPALLKGVNRYIHVLMSELAQTAGCNRFHVVEQRLARWLLMTSDRAHSSTFHITHEFLAFMLGVRRVGITKAARALQGLKLIEYARGKVSILDREGLERASCECYRVDLDTYKRAFK